MAERRKGRMNVGVFFKNTGHHLASWRHPDCQPDAGINLEHYVACARTAEAAGLDFIFFADSAAVRETSTETLSRSSQFTAYFEPTTLLSALAMVTSRIGLVSTATTSFNEPYNIARRFASLDHLSKGRAGWNVVTSGMQAEALNFNLEEHYEHDFRYRKAHEFVQVVRGLWDSWDDDAFLYDREGGRFFDPGKLHRLDHKGEFYKVRGPLNVPRPPQGAPVIFQAGMSEAGRELAAETAEGVFSGQLTIPRSAELYKDLKTRMRRYGRKPSEMVMLPGVTVTCAATDAEAKQKDEYLNSLIHPIVGRDYVATMTGLDLSDCDPEDPVPDRKPVRGHSAIGPSMIALARSEGLNIKGLYMRLAGSHGKLSMVGSVSRIADTMRDWFDGHACDGFILQPSYMPGNLDEVAKLLVPELQDRGLIRVGYEGTTLREHMGLARPVSRYAKSSDSARPAAE